MIVDCHVHFWRYPQHFNKEAMLANQPRRRRDWAEEKFQAMWDNPPEGYLAEMDGVVEKAIILGLKSWATFGVETPNDWLAEIVQRYPDKFAWCCCVVPTQEGAVEEVERCVKEKGAVGIGELGPAYGAYYANDERCFPVYKKAMELGVPVVIHASPSQPARLRMAYGDIYAVDDIAIRFPELKIVIAHMGYYKYEDALHLVQKHENVFADISWLAGIAGLDRRAIPRYLPVVNFPYYHWLHPLLYYFSQTWGPTDKLLYGTDWAAVSPKEGVAILMGVNETLRKYNLPEIPEKSLHNILEENWKKVFDLKGGKGNG